MSASDFITQLELAADSIADVSRADLQILLRRAALRIRNANGLALDPEVDDAVRAIGDELGHERNEMLRVIIREWLEQNAYLPVHMLDEGSDTDGRA